MDDDIWSDLDARDFYADLWGGGGNDWSGMPEYSSPPMDFGYGGGSGYEDFGGTTSSGSGGYRIGDQWYDIQTPTGGPQAYTPGMVSNNGGMLPGTEYNAATNWLQSRQAAEKSIWDAFGQQPGMTGGGGGGGVSPSRNASVSNRPYEMMSLGKPDREMYDLYTGMLKNPSQLDQNPAYQFLYNQGLQALNRSLAAKKMTLSGKGMNDTLSFGQGQAANFANQMLPQYRAGAQEELSRFMGPAGLLPNYVNSNNSAVAKARSEDLGFGGGLDGMLSGGMPSQNGGSFTGAGIGMGGVRSGYNPVGLQPAQEIIPQARLAQSYSEPSPYPYYDGYSYASGKREEAYGG